ncbi:MAG: hypothetical protein EBR82_14160 [Caulobacteraceae bacterium]|nr:hypothetical protein [Caulobacteraceae bacterium]
MDTIDKNKLRILFVDILKGYTIAYYKNNKLYFKHNTSIDSGDIDHIKQEFIQKAKRNGLPTEQQKEEYIIKENLWSNEKNEEIKKIKSYISGLKQTKSKLFRNDDIAQINKQINEENIKLFTLIAERKDLLGFTVEDYANKKVNEYYMFNSLFKDKDLKNKFFSEQEFDELENRDLSEILDIYNNMNKNYVDKNLKKIALSSYYLSLFNLSDDNPYYMYGKPIVYLTFYQMEVFGYARYFKNALSEAKHKPPDEYYEDPDKLIDWLESSKNVEEVLSKNENNQKKTEGAIATSIVGAKKEDLAKIGKDENGISLHKEALKKGGTLTMEDLMKMHGI